MPAAVNCLVSEPMRNTVFAFMGATSSRLARPYPLANTNSRLRRTATVAPATRPDETSSSAAVSIFALIAGSRRVGPE